tara:strand:+ start:2255 stop:3199 length:945 start_codon:yes stop_codon:yes gene_type:complete
MAKGRVAWLTAIIIIIIGVYYFFQKGQELIRLKNLSLSQACMAFTVIMIYNLISGRKFKLLFEAYKIRLTIKEWFGLPQVVYLFDLLFFKSGLMVSAYYLKKNLHLSYSRYLVAMSALKISDLFAATFMGLIYSFALFIFYGIKFYVVLIFVVLLAVLTVFVKLSFLLPIKEKELKSGALKKVIEITKLWNEYKRNTITIVKLILLSFIAIPMYGVRYYVAFHILNYQVSIFECIMISIIIHITGFISIIPGNIGIRETVVGILSYFMGYNFDYGIIAATVDRIFSTLFFVFFGIIFFNVLHLKGYSRNHSTIC